MFVRELLLKKDFSFDKEAIKAKAYREGDDYRLNFNFFYEDASSTALQTLVRRVSRWKIIATDIQMTYNETSNKIVMQVQMTIFKSRITGPTYLIEVIYT